MLKHWLVGRVAESLVCDVSDNADDADQKYVKTRLTLNLMFNFQLLLILR